MTREGIEYLSANFHTGGQVVTSLGYVALFPSHGAPNVSENQSASPRGFLSRGI